MKKPKEIAERIVFLADNGEGLHPISEGAKLIESYAKQHAIKLTEWIILTEPDLPYCTAVDLYDEWLNQQTKP